MSGHSKWSQIKRQKGVNDAQRGQVFTQLAREVMMAARQGGASPDSNFRLRLAIERAREANMPMDNIDRAIKRATGEGENLALEEIVYEGYGPSGVAVLVQAVTDNRNRTVAEVRNVFAKSGGSLGESGSVGWLFDEKGVITVDVTGKDPDEIALAVIDAGAEDFNNLDENTLEVYTLPETLESVRKALDGQKLSVTSAEVSMLPKTTVMLDEQKSTQMLRLLDKLEELDDVQKVVSNADFPDEVLANME